MGYIPPTLGPGEGNRGALIRWGRFLDNGVWLRIRKYRRLWPRWRFRRGYLDIGFVVIRWGN